MRLFERPVKELSIIMPTYNEAGHIVDFINAAIGGARRWSLEKLEVILVDDDSPDETWKLVEETEFDGAEVKVLRRKRNRGLTNSLRDGIDASQTDTVVWLDCDFSQPPELIYQMLFMLSLGYEVVVNSRYISGGGEERSGEGGQLQLFLSRAFNWVIRFMLEPKFSDYTSGYIAIKKSLLRKYPLRGDYGEYFIELIYRAMCGGHLVCELPYYGVPRRTGVSKTGSGLFTFLRRGRKYLWTAAKLKILRLLGRL